MSLERSNCLTQVFNYLRLVLALLEYKINNLLFNKQVLEEIKPDLERFGHRVATDINFMGRQCELQPPKLEHFDAWGQMVGWTVFKHVRGGDSDMLYQQRKI